MQICHEECAIIGKGLMFQSSISEQLWGNDMLIAMLLSQKVVNVNDVKNINAQSAVDEILIQ